MTILTNLFFPLLSLVVQVNSLPFYVDVTEESGINFVHQTGSAGQFYLPETMGSGATFFDYDSDGDVDLYLVNSGHFDNSSEVVPNTLYRNDGDNQFTNVTRQAKIGHTSYEMGAIAADYDNDGDTDLYVTNFGSNVLYRNNGDGTFSDVSQQARIDDARWSTSAAFLDYDLDGWLDLMLLTIWIIP